MRNTNKLVRGIGVKGMDYPVWSNGKEAKEYTLWSSMLTRCTEKLWVRRPTYTGTTCSENFKHYSFFYEWCQEQVGFKSKDENGKRWHLDKDLLVKGNKVYSEDMCVFIPQSMNNLLINCNNYRGECPIGVRKRNSKFLAECGAGKNGRRGLDGKWVRGQKHIGCFDTQEEAFRAYKKFKEALIKEVANEYKDKLDPRAYQALLNYTVEITD